MTPTAARSASPHPASGTGDGSGAGGRGEPPEHRQAPGRPHRAAGWREDHGVEVVSRAQLRKKSQITLPQDVRDALRLSEGDEVEFTVHADGEVTLRGMIVIPTEQRWFWAEDWQAGEREASEEIAAGHTTVYDSAEEFLSHLDELDAST